MYICIGYRISISIVELGPWVMGLQAFHEAQNDPVQARPWRLSSRGPRSFFVSTSRLWCLMVYSSILWDIMGCTGMSWYGMGHKGIVWYLIVCSSILWDIKVCYGILWYIMSSPLFAEPQCESFLEVVQTSMNISKSRCTCILYAHVYIHIERETPNL